ncbi:hypothetical protein Tco_0044314 [Tanacetum coccineum]
MMSGIIQQPVLLLQQDRPIHSEGRPLLHSKEDLMDLLMWLCLSLDVSMTRLGGYPWLLATMHVQHVMSYELTVVAQSALILELQSADHRRQRVISELLASDHKRQVQLTKTLRLLKGLQTQMVEFQRQHGPVKGPAQPDAPGEAGSSS